ncbi:MAG TPA: hypothetical protein VN950_03240 [Terriglobales bacterium]|nr:hypothetical protein [Terriglobales bacterium]
MYIVNRKMAGDFGSSVAEDCLDLRIGEPCDLKIAALHSGFATFPAHNSSSGDFSNETVATTLSNVVCLIVTAMQKSAARDS